MTKPKGAKKGALLAVDPIRRREDVASIKKLLSDRPRDLLLFVLGINNGLRVPDLLKLKVGQLRKLKLGQYLKVREGKTGKPNRVVMNKGVRKALDNYLLAESPSDDDYLFQSREGNNKPLHPVYVGQMIRSWCRAINLQEHYGNHSLRKTFAYHQWKYHGVGWEQITDRLNHAYPGVTKTYLGVTEEDAAEICLNEI